MMERPEELIKRWLTDAGCVAAGFAPAVTVSDGYAATLNQWIGEGCHASMQYMERHAPLRLDPRRVMPEANTIISVAIPYLPAIHRRSEQPQVALYAAGRDYHKTVVRMLRPVCRQIETQWDAHTRICVDTAPVAERYWALQAGIGMRGRNGLVITPDYGSYIFLAEILTTLKLRPDSPSATECCGCGACERACPGKAIRSDGTIDARRCLSYLTIEHRGDFSSDQQDIMTSPRGRDTLYGCDICQIVCPHNRTAAVSTITDFAPSRLWLTLDDERIASVTPEEWDIMTRGSAMRRANLDTLKSIIQLRQKNNLT